MPDTATDNRPVLVVTELGDPTADLVIAELHDRHVPVVRLDPGGFPADVTLAAQFDCDGLSGHLVTGTRDVDLTSVRSVYWRRPSPYKPVDGLTGQDARWCTDQARHGLGGTLAALPGAFYISHPWRIRDAEHKPTQLATAAACSLAVPPTVVTNDPLQARRFAAEHGPVVYKPLWNTAYTAPDGSGRTIWAEQVDPGALDEAVAGTAHLFQQRVDKASDVRLTVVGEELFPVRIDGARHLDWRRDYAALSYELIEAPAAVEKGVRAFLDAFGLVFGAFDFGIDRDGRWWLYECNPNGQWAWFPEPIPARITAALANQLQHPGGHP